jgi:hypothetical protein
MNTQITEDYVSFEVAKLLKEKGFNECCHSSWDYNPNKENTEVFIEYIANGIANNKELEQYNEPDSDWAVSAPTLQTAMKWLRKTHNIDVCVCREIDEYGDCFDGYIAVVYINKVYKVTIRDAEKDLLYEEAAEIAIKYCLEYLVENKHVKNGKK